MYHQVSDFIPGWSSFSEMLFLLLSNMTMASSRVTNISREKNPIFHISPGKIKGSLTDESHWLNWGQRAILESIIVARL